MPEAGCHLQVVVFVVQLTAEGAFFGSALGQMQPARTGPVPSFVGVLLTRSLLQLCPRPGDYGFIRALVNIAKT